MAFDPAKCYEEYLRNRKPIVVLKSGAIRDTLDSELKGIDKVLKEFSGSFFLFSSEEFRDARILLLKYGHKIDQEAAKSVLPCFVEVTSSFHGNHEMDSQLGSISLWALADDVPGYSSGNYPKWRSSNYKSKSRWPESTMEKWLKADSRFYFEASKVDSESEEIKASINFGRLSWAKLALIPREDIGAGLEYCVPINPKDRKITHISKKGEHHEVMSVEKPTFLKAYDYLNDILVSEDEIKAKLKDLDN